MEFRRLLNRMNGNEVEQVMLYFKLGVISFAKQKERRQAVIDGEIAASLTNQELATLSLLVILGATVYASPESLLARLNMSGIELLKELEEEHG